MKKTLTSVLTAGAVAMHPALIGCYLGLFFIELPLLVLLVFAVLFVLPVLLTYLMYKDVLLQKQRDRLYPLLFTGGIYLLSAILAQVLDKEHYFPPTYLSALVAIGASLLVLALLNRFTKVSLHAFGISGFWLLLGFLLFQEPLELSHFLTFGLITLFALLSLLALIHRLATKAHTPFQLVLGLVAGVVLPLLFLRLFLLAGGAIA